MKKLLGILVLGLLWCNVGYTASSWFEITNRDNTSNYWNLKEAEEIGSNKFKIPLGFKQYLLQALTNLKILKNELRKI
tara:strand:+ start:119 stop:352 length:234 start_codon:yes stop_codon:yes gene_type:complete